MKAARHARLEIVLKMFRKARNKATWATEKDFNYFLEIKHVKRSFCDALKESLNDMYAVSTILLLRVLLYAPSVAPCSSAAAGTLVRSLPRACSSCAAAAALPDRPPPPAVRPAAVRPLWWPLRPPCKDRGKKHVRVCLGLEV